MSLAREEEEEEEERWLPWELAAPFFLVFLGRMTNSAERIFWLEIGDGNLRLMFSHTWVLSSFSTGKGGSEISSEFTFHSFIQN